MSERTLLARGEGGVEPPDQSGLDTPLHARLLKQLSKREAARYRTAMRLLSSGGGVEALIRQGNLPLAGLGIYEALLTRSWAVRFQNKEEMVHLALAAAEVARKFKPKILGPERAADLQARAWAELGNAYRASNQLRSAESAFGQAYVLFMKGTGDPYLKARLFDLEASLRGTWRDFEAAESRLRVVADLYKKLGEPHLSGRAFVSLALYTFYSCRPEEALLLNSEGKNLIDPRQDPALYCMAVHNDLLFLVDLGRYSEAKRTLFESRQHFIYKDNVNEVRLRWIGGRIDCGLKNFLSAELAFKEVRESFDKLALPFSSAIARLDLAVALLKQDKFEEAEQEVLAAQDLFKNIEVYREYLGSMVLLEELFKQRTVTPVHIQNAIAEIWRKNLQVGPRHFR